VTAMAWQQQVLLRQQVEEFLYAEAALLDAWVLDDWLLLFDEDAKYEVPCNDAPDGDPATEPDRLWPAEAVDKTGLRHTGAAGLA